MESVKTMNLIQSKIIPIAGDASFRKFYRISNKKKNKIIISVKKEKYKNLVAYIAINKFLRNNKILTPKLYSCNYSKGIAIIEDFGNFSFQKILNQNKNKVKIYKKLVDLLIKMQQIKPQYKIKNIFKKFHIIDKYSIKYLHKESDLFFDWYLPLLFNKKKTLSIKKKIKKILSKIYKNINFPNSYFVHRDFHVENLMKVGNKIGVIDSQDALIGNPAYDLVSLVDDVRIKTSQKIKKQVYNYYIKKSRSIHDLNPKKFIEDFNTLSIQRNLKIIGIFSRLFKRDQKKKYLKFIPYTWKLLEIRMKSKKFSDLRKMINRNISKKIRKKIII